MAGIPNTILGFLSLRLLLNINYFLAIFVSEILGQFVKYFSHKYFFSAALNKQLKFTRAFLKAYALTFIINAFIGYLLKFVILNLNILAFILTLLPILVSMMVSFFIYKQHK